MRIIVISDIHANIEAVRLFSDYLETADYSRIYCLGDMIGYGDHPNEVISFLKQAGALSIMGNHEDLFLKGDMSEKYNFPRTREILTRDSLEYIANLPVEIQIKSSSTIFSHAVPFTRYDYLYPNSDFRVLDQIPYKRIFLGHTHYPMLASYYDKTILNPGSLGQPRDKINRPSFLVCDLDSEEYQFLRLTTQGGGHG